ncbi:MAG TPA: HIT domain-containing protein [Candidatus Deferrimicrobium sp.]|nr:HIT domain-containing protein [Candidatus Deferrimicrobium sp.]
MSDDFIWAPWRAEFVLREKEPGCVFCNRFKMEDSVTNLIVHRAKLSFVILNKFPYNSGHSMVVPNRHIAHLEELSADEFAELFELVRKTVAVTKQALKPHSLNVGINLGESSGAGIPGHLHVHVVPRWHGDTNFMPVIGHTKVISVPLEPVYLALRKGFAAP